MKIILCDEEEIKSFIDKCEGHHIQQVAYSSYHKAFTQVCINCGCVRTSLKLKEIIKKLEDKAYWKGQEGSFIVEEKLRKEIQELKSALGQEKKV